MTNLDAIMTLDSAVRQNKRARTRLAAPGLDNRDCRGRPKRHDTLGFVSVFEYWADPNARDRFFCRIEVVHAVGDRFDGTCAEYALSELVVGD